MTRHNPPPGGPNAQAGSHDAGVITYGDPLEFGAAWPEHLRRAVFDYIERGDPMGGYLTHLFSGRVWSAVCNADSQNYARFAAQCRWIAQVAPSGCYGSAEKVGAWIGIGGLAGDDGSAGAAFRTRPHSGSRSERSPTKGRRVEPMAVITRIHIEVRPLAGDTDCSACEPTDKDAERGAPATCHVAVGPSWAMVTFDLCDQCRALLAARVALGEG